MTTPIISELSELEVGNKCALQAYRGSCVWCLEEHIALAQQPFRTGLVKDDAAVHVGGDREGNTSREISFDQTGDDIGRRALGGDDQMNTSCARKLSQTGDGTFGLIRSQHHQVCQLVDDHNNIRKSLFTRLGFMIVEFINIAGTIFFEDTITQVHLAQHPVQRSHHFFSINDHIRQQVGNAVVNRKLHPFGVHQQQAQLIGGHIEQKAAQDRVDTNRFTGTGRARYQ